MTAKQCEASSTLKGRLMVHFGLRVYRFRVSQTRGGELGAFGFYFFGPGVD